MKQRFFVSLFFLFLLSKSSSQSFSITQPKLEFDGRILQISYDLVNKNQSDRFFVWVEIAKKNGETIVAKSLKGDVGENVRAGMNKQIIWIPADDFIILDEEVSVEIKAEKYVKSFNKGSAMLMSAALPGLGQTKISKGTPWWLTGVATYGLLVGGYVFYSTSLKTYDSYKVEEDITKREDLYNQAQQQQDISTVMIASGVAMWAANMIWAALIPNKYQPLQHVKITLDQSTGTNKGTTLLTLKLNF